MNFAIACLSTEITLTSVVKHCIVPKISNLIWDIVNLLTVFSLYDTNGNDIDYDNYTISNKNTKSSAWQLLCEHKPKLRNLDVTSKLNYVRALLLDQEKIITSQHCLNTHVNDCDGTETIECKNVALLESYYALDMDRDYINKRIQEMKSTNTCASTNSCHKVCSSILISTAMSDVSKSSKILTEQLKLIQEEVDRYNSSWNIFSRVCVSKFVKIIEVEIPILDSRIDRLLKAFEFLKD